LWNREQDKQIRTSEDIVTAINEAERRNGNMSLQYILDELKKPEEKITINLGDIMVYSMFSFDLKNKNNLKISVQKGEPWKDLPIKLVSKKYNELQF
jgi:hypothetical protein